MWNNKILNDSCHTTSGGTPSRKNKSFYGGTIPWIKSGELNNSTIYVSEELITEEAVQKSSAKIFTKGTLLIALYGATVGKLAFLGIDAAPNQAICGLFPSEKLDRKFLFWYLFFKRPQLIKQSIGGAQPNISQGSLRNLQLSIPPLSEQHTIVERIEELFSELDSGVENLRKTQLQLKAYRQSVLRWAFDQPSPIVMLEQISEAVGGYAFRSKNFDNYGQYQVIRIGNIRPGIIRTNESLVFVSDVEDKVLAKYLLQKGDVLISLTGTRKKRDYGYTTIVNEENFLLNQRVAYIRFDDRCLPKFFLYFSWTDFFKSQFCGSETGNVGQGNVDMKSIRQTSIPLPPIVEQHQIVQEIERRLSVADQLEQSINHSLQQSEAVRQSILKMAFNGRLTEKWREENEEKV
ncbi:MAG: restriction endonuclease subunit S [Bacteroidia bacterium]